MKLNTWPITPDDIETYQFDGKDPDHFLAIALDGIAPKLPATCDGSHLAEEILDPFVFFQFITGMQGKHTINGTPFYQNWRLLPCALRMARRLGADGLADALEQSKTEMAAFDPQTLDDYDHGRLPWDTKEDQALSAKLDTLFDIRLRDQVDAGDCTYGTTQANTSGSERLNAALADWVSQEFPREVLDDFDAVTQRHQDNHDWARDNTDGYDFGFTSGLVGIETYHMLQEMGLRLQRLTRRPQDPASQRVIPNGILTTDGQEWIRFDFGDGCLIADAKTLTEQARAFYPAPRNRPKTLPPFLLLAKAPRVEFNATDFTTRPASFFRRSAHKLSYKN